MKKIFTFIILSIAIVVPSFAQQYNDENDDTENVELELKTGDDRPLHGRDRSLSLYVDAYYNPCNHIIEVCYYGDRTGEVFLYLNDSLIDSSPDLNTSFQLTTPGLYKIVIIEESWIATGYITY